MKTSKIKFIANISLANEPEICETLKARNLSHLKFKLAKHHHTDESGNWFTCGPQTDFESVPVDIEIIAL